MNVIGRKYINETLIIETKYEKPFVLAGESGVKDFGRFIQKVWSKKTQKKNSRRDLWTVFRIRILIIQQLLTENASGNFFHFESELSFIKNQALSFKKIFS